MVAQRKRYIRCAPLIYLSLALIAGCSDTQYTVIQLHHKSPSEVTDILNEQLNGNVEFKISGQSIVFYAEPAKIKNTIDLLNILDKPSHVYSLEFSWKNPYRRSTITLPRSMNLVADGNNTVELFDHFFEINIEPRNQTQVLLTIKKKTKKKNRVKEEQHYVLSLNQASELIHPLMPDDVMITIKGI